jgi:hypothetical protein
MLYAAVLLVLTAICAVAGIITCAPIVFAWLKARQSDSPTPNSQQAIPSTKRWAFVLAISSLALVFSFYGLIRVYQHKELPAATGARIVWQKPISSEDPRFPFGWEVGIQTDESYNEPAQLFIACDGDIGDAHGVRLVNGGDLQAVNEVSSRRFQHQMASATVETRRYSDCPILFKDQN